MYDLSNTRGRTIEAILHIEIADMGIPVRSRVHIGDKMCRGRLALMQISKTQDILSLVLLWFIAIPMEFDGCFTTRRKFTSDILGSSEKQGKTARVFSGHFIAKRSSHSMQVNATTNIQYMLVASICSKKLFTNLSNLAYLS